MINKELFRRDKKHMLTVDIHGAPLVFHSDQKLIVENLRRNLKYFASGNTAPRKGLAAHCSLSILKQADYAGLKKLYRPRKTFEAFPGVRATFGAIGDSPVYEIKSSCFIILDDRTNDCACVLRRPRNKKIIHTDFVVHILIIEWLRSKGLFFIHSSGISRDGDAYLFIGPSGSGKTTASLMGIQRGMSFMGDDLLIVKETGGKITVHSFIEEVKFCLDMTGRFRELGGMKNRKAKTMKFDVKKYFDVKISDKASVAGLYFLNKGNTLRKLKTNEALPLIMNSSFFHSREDATLRHFEILCRLIDSTESYMVGRSFLNRHMDRLTGSKPGSMR